MKQVLFPIRSIMIMNNKKQALLTLAMLGLASLPSQATTHDVDLTVKFAEPTRIMAGDKYLGQRRAYPSPALHDVNGDGHMDLLIADLRGRVTVALGTGSKPMSFGEEKPLLGSDKEPLDFNNW